MRFKLLLPALFVALTLSAPAMARSTLDSILPGIRAEHPGRLSDAEPWTDQNGRVHYRIKWMTPQGRILYFDADPETGRYRSTGGGEGEWRGGRRNDDARDNRGNGDGGRHSNWRDDGSYGNWDNGNSGRDRNGRSGDWGGGDGPWRGGGHGGGGRWNGHDNGGGRDNGRDRDNGGGRHHH
ncbi:MAG: hypothetical protein JSR60_14950 [Proteobacteria bacterium]|nr:hypothetical protein [Pseudomonadota bacterium]